MTTQKITTQKMTTREMTGVDIDDMPAGREMDELIDRHVAKGNHYRAEHKYFKNRFVFKWVPVENWSPWVKEQFEQGSYGEWEFCGPAYSTDVSAAWPLVEKFGLTITPGYKCWMAAKCNAGGSGETTWVGLTNHQDFTKAETAPLAICRAVLKAKMNLEVD